MIPSQDLEDLTRAKHLLESPGLAIKLANYVGKPVEWGINKLPSGARDLVVSATQAAMEKALGVAVSTLDGKAAGGPRDWLHRASVIVTGAVGGVFGLPALAVELPVSTVIMLRSVADHARAQGEDLHLAEARMNCLLVFALGGRSPSDDSADVGYFAVRATLARAVAEAAEFIAERTAAEVLADKSSPIIARLVARLVARFTPAVADKIAAQLVPIVGAAGGAAINTLFINHFQDMAWSHFTIRRLERKYGAAEVQSAYAAAPTTK